MLVNAYIPPPLGLLYNPYNLPRWYPILKSPLSFTYPTVHIPSAITPKLAVILTKNQAIFLNFVHRTDSDSVAKSE